MGGMLRERHKSFFLHEPRVGFDVRAIGRCLDGVSRTKADTPRKKSEILSHSMMIKSFCKLSLASVRLCKIY